MKKTYRTHFSNQIDAVRYDETEYGDTSYGNLLWEMEKDYLRALILELREKNPHIRYLDFASGTGRLASFLEGLVQTSTSIEISESMADRARSHLRSTQVLCRDITTNADVVEGKYELITAFRFFLNAEPALRLAALKALAARLQDSSSWLVFNNHGNPFSTKLAGWPYHRLRGWRDGWKPYGNYLTHSQIKELLNQANLRIVKVFGLGVLGGKICARLPFEKALRIESNLRSIPFLAKLGQDQIYVVNRIEPGTNG